MRTIITACTLDIAGKLTITTLHGELALELKVKPEYFKHRYPNATKEHFIRRVEAANYHNEIATKMLCALGFHSGLKDGVEFEVKDLVGRSIDAMYLQRNNLMKLIIPHYE